MPREDEPSLTHEGEQADEGESFGPRPSMPSVEETLQAEEPESSPEAPTQAGEGRAPSRPARGLQAGQAVGRHVVVERLGSGGMGVVYAAYDPKLDRKVALKLLLPGLAGRTGRKRLLREAQALAKLSHPNVVAVHDMGEVGDQVWIAMELVQGQTLTRWLRTPRRWPEVLEVMRSAGQGLAAAHAAGVLHRDFKPDNVMVGDDGRVRVMDFGLARVHIEPTEEGEGKPVVLSSIKATHAGGLVGTPAYMAPEQFGGWEVTAAADQFSFCVALWEALYGERPFAGDTWMELSENVLNGRVRPPARGRRVPGWLQRACERGLSLGPAKRWPSLGALLDELGTGRARARLRAGLLGVAGLGLVAAGVVGWRHYAAVRQQEACEASGDEVERAWGPEREQRLREALMATEAGHAAATVDKLVPWLGRYADDWRGARVQACRRAHVDQRWDAQTLERSRWCLDERRMEFESLVDALTVEDDEVLSVAVPAAAGLASVDPCLDEPALGRLEAPPPEEREATGEVRAEVARAGSLAYAGRYDEGLAHARGALEHASALGWRPLEAKARVMLGRLLEHTGAYEDAEVALADAYFEAAEGLAPEVAFEAASDLVRVVGYRRAKPEQGRLWGRLAELSLKLLDEADGLRRAELLDNLGELEHTHGEYEEAMRHQQRALAIKESIFGPDHLELAKNLNHLANLHHDNGAFEQGLAMLERVVSIYEQSLGPDHPSVGDALIGLARIHGGMGAPQKAKPLLERALAIHQRAGGEGHPRTGVALNNLALVLRALGELDESIRLQRRAIAIFEQTMGPEHPNVAIALTDLAGVYILRRDATEARSLLERSLSISEKTLGPQHPSVGRTLGTLARTYTLVGDHQKAVQLLQRVLPIFEDAFGPEHHEVAFALRLLADGYVLAGKPASAEPLYARALAIVEKVRGPEHHEITALLAGRALAALALGRADDAVPWAERALGVALEAEMLATDLAFTRFVVARVLWDASIDGGRDRARALSLARQARDEYERAGEHGAGEHGAGELAEVQQWLREREPAVVIPNP